MSSLNNSHVFTDMLHNFFVFLASIGISQDMFIVLVVAFLLGGFFLGGGHRHVYRYYRRYRYRDYW